MKGERDKPPQTTDLEAAKHETDDRTGIFISQSEVIKARNLFFKSVQELNQIHPGVIA